MVLRRPTDCFAQPYFDITLSRVTPFFSSSIFLFSVQYFFFQFNICIFFSVCSANGIFLSEQMVGEAMQSAEVYDFLVTGRERARYAGNGPDGFVLDWLIRFPRRAKMDFVKRVEMDLVETHLEQLCSGLFCAAWKRLGNTLCLQTSQSLFM